MTAVIILAILAVSASWFLWSHLKQMQADDLARELMHRASKKQIKDREDYDGKLK